MTRGRYNVQLIYYLKSTYKTCQYQLLSSSIKKLFTLVDPQMPYRSSDVPKKHYISDEIWFESKNTRQVKKHNFYYILTKA